MKTANKLLEIKFYVECQKCGVRHCFSVFRASRFLHPTDWLMSWGFLESTLHTLYYLCN